MGVVDLVDWGENYLTGNSTELSLPHEKYRYILDERDVIDLTDDDFDSAQQDVIDLSDDDL